MKLIVVDENSTLSSDTYNGGDRQLRKLLPKLEELFNTSYEVVTPSLSSKSINFISSVGSLLKVFFETKNKKNIKGDILLISSPYLNDLISGLRTSRRYNIPAVVYFHHYFSPLYKMFRRGLIHSIFYGLSLSISMSICKIFQVPIFLDNHQHYSLGTIKIYENECATEGIQNIPTQTIKNVMGNQLIKFVTVGRIQKHKGATDSLKLIELLKAQGMDVLLIFVGKIDPKMRKNLLQLCRKKGLSSNIQFSGWLSEKSKIKTLLQSHIYISLSYEEGWNVGVMEAAVLGLPIIAYDLFAYDYLKGNFQKVEIGNINDAKNKVLGILNDYERVKSIAMKARRETQNYNYTKIASYQYSVFQEIINNYKNKRFSFGSTREGSDKQSTI